MWTSFQKLLVGRYRRRLTPRTASSLKACAAPGAGGGLHAKLAQLHAAAELWEAALRDGETLARATEDEAMAA